MKQAFKYSLKVWLTSVIISPALIMTGDKLLHPNDDIGFNGFFGFIGYAIIYGLVLTIPCSVILFLFVGSLVNRKITEFYKRLMISILASILTILPFYILFHRDDNFLDWDLIVWVFSYLALIIAAVWLYRLEPKPIIAAAAPLCE